MKSRQSASSTTESTALAATTSRSAGRGNSERAQSLGLEGEATAAGGGDLLTLLPTLGPLATVVLDAMPPADARRIASLLRDVPDIHDWLSTQGEADTGTALPADLAEQAQASLGADVSDVRVHTDPASAKLTDDLGFEAFTEGQDIYFGAGQFKPNDPHGRFVAMHELAHVAASNGSGTASASAVSTDTSHEADADAAAGAALSGEGYTLQSAPGGIYGFGAGTHEEITEKSGANAGLTEEQTDAVYKGNWERDMTAAIFPTTGNIPGLSLAIVAILDILARKKFGSGLDPKTLGSYDPIEHIDNPTGQTGTSVWEQEAGRETAFRHEEADASGGAYSAIDSRYADAASGMTSAIPGGQAGDDAAFIVDESGLPAYMIASRDLLQTRLADAVKWGGDVAEGTAPSGAEIAGDATHILQDFYAHSNFCEIAINLLIKEQKVLTGQAGATPLDTGVHAVNPDGTINTGENLTTEGGREVMATSSFTTEDTAYSVAKIGLELLDEYDPFKADGPMDLIGPVLSWVEDNPAYMGSLGDVMNGVATTMATILVPILDGALATGSATHGALGAVESGLIDAGAAVGGAVTSGVSGLLDMVGADDAAAAVAGAGASLGSAAATADEQSSDDTSAMVNGCNNARAQLDGIAQSLANGEGGLTALGLLMQGMFEPLLTLSNIVREIPVVGPMLAGQMEGAEEELREYAREQLEKWWTKVKEDIRKELEEALQEHIGETDVDPSADTTGSDYMTTPSHTDIAKDFEHAGAPTEADTDQDGHTDMSHSGAALTGLAQAMATAASQAVLAKLNACWETPDQEEALTAMNTEVERWFAHPEDCRDTWEETFIQMISMNPLLRDEIVTRTSLPMEQQ